jgi:hypothetical protein
MVFRSSYLLLLFAVAAGNGAPKATLSQQFEKAVQPYVQKYCVGCHSGQNPAAQFNLKSYTSIEQVTQEFPRWHLVMERLKAQDMPPKPMKAPPAEATKPVIEWIEAVRATEMKRWAGDPGHVPARRLSNAEYNYTIRDLTGQDLQVTREFPVDPANPAGFDNSGESLTMSPALLNKYLQASREIANHAVLLPDTIAFAPHPMLVETDREKYTVQRIMDFYARQPIHFRDYFHAAWKYKYRAALGNPKATLASLAKDLKLSAKYLPMVWEILNEANALGPIAKLQKCFRRCRRLRARQRRPWRHSARRWKRSSSASGRIRECSMRLPRCEDCRPDHSRCCIGRIICSRCTGASSIRNRCTTTRIRRVWLRRFHAIPDCIRKRHPGGRL